MGKIISVANQKGGVGKTTTAVNLSAAMGYIGQKTLLIDIDPQGNATSGVGINRRNTKTSTYDILIGQKSAKEVLLETEFKNLSILPSNMELAAAELELVELAGRESKLKDSICELVLEYDYIFIDCPPSLGIITANAFCASNSILVPIQCEYYALEGLSQLMNTVRKIKMRYNKKLEIESVLLTMYDGRLNLTQQVVSEVKRYFPKKVFATVIPRTVRLSEAPGFGKPIIYYDQHSKGTEAYLNLAEEIKKTI
jgi:chromosome partitioning protein